ncbi:MAG: ATP-dependent protease [Planctomycetes bacterium]|nr:ATP-dependent protease [Planctomycetota bacterium]
MAPLFQPAPPVRRSASQMVPMPDASGLPASALRWRCPPESVSAAAAPGGDRGDCELLGQERALAALRLGLEIDAPGWHVFVSGLPGSGREQAVRRLLEGLADRCAVVPDKAYVHGFADPARPRLLELPAGRVGPFARRMAELADDLIARLESLAEDEAHLKRRRRLEEALNEASTRHVADLAAATRPAGLSLYEVKEHGFVRPALGVVDGDDIVPIEALHLLVQQGRIDAVRAQELEAAARPLRAQLERTVIELRRAARARTRELAAFERDQAHAAIRPELEDAAEEFGLPAIEAFLKQVEQWTLDHFARSSRGRFARELRRRLAVNVVLDHSARTGAPIVVVAHPTPQNLFGSIDVRTGRNGAVRADHRSIRAGALLQADGGWLVLKAGDLLAEEGAFAALRRALKHRRVELQPVEGTVALKPEPMPFRVKVVLIGEEEHEAFLEENDPEFRDIFKVRAEFDDQVERTDANVARYAALLRRIAAEERLRPLADDAVAALLEEAARRSGRGGRLSTRVSPLIDLSREADLLAQRDGATVVSAVHVLAALASAREREALPERRFHEQIRAGTLLLVPRGERVGQVHALTVVSGGSFDFGRPARVTATVAAGDHGLLNIEREVQLSGDIHDKGVFILGALLRERFAQSHPLALSASLCFEQSYGPIDGDSAAAAEWFALLSAIAWAPLRQSIGVTGSINQKGEIQPVGGVNEKIEGFFDLCALGTQDGPAGVIFPRRNVADLMLASRVIDAVAAGRFHLWPIDHVDEGIELLTGVAAGSAGPDGRYPKESINGRCADHLWYLAEVARDAKAANEPPAAASGPVAPPAAAAMTDPAAPPGPAPQ